MHVRIVTFQLDGITADDYAAHCEEIAARFNEWPGLLSKVWLADPDSNTFGGVYLFDSVEAADHSRSSAQYGAMVDSPDFRSLEVVEFGVLDAPTAVTSAHAVAG